MRKCNSKFTSMILALVMLASLIVVPSAAASELNEITGLVWDVNSITGIKLANSAADSANMQAMLAIYNGKELDSLITADVHSGSKKVLFPSATELVAGQTAKALLWDTTGGAINPLAVNYPVTADGEAYSSCEIKGASQIVLPADNANYRTKNDFSLFDSELGENVKASFTITGNDTTGLTMLADGTLLATPDANAGTISVNAQYGCKTYTKEVTLVKGYYNDFENEELGTMPSNLDGEAFVVATSDGMGNSSEKYMSISYEKQVSYSLASKLTDGVVTIEFDALRIPTYLNVDTREDRSILLLGSATKTSNNRVGNYFSLTMRTKSTNKNDVVTNIGENGESKYKQLLAESNEYKWINVKVNLDYTKGTYDISLDNNLMIEAYKFQIDHTGHYLENIITQVPFDNINVYSGKMYDPLAVYGTDTIVLPADNADFSTSINYSLCDVDTDAEVNGATFTISGDTKGLTMATDGTLTATSTATPGKVTITAVKDGRKYTKEIATIDGYSQNFEDAQAGTITNLSGWSKNNACDASVTSDENNFYVKRTAGYYSYGNNDGYTLEGITAEFDVLFDADTTAAQLGEFANRKKADGSGTEYYNLNNINKSGSAYTITTSYNKDGSSAAVSVLSTKQIGETAKIKYVLNYVDGTYDMYVDGELKLDDYSFPKAGSGYTFDRIIFRSNIDNLNIYTGTKN